MPVGPALSHDGVLDRFLALEVVKLRASSLPDEHGSGEEGCEVAGTGLVAGDSGIRPGNEMSNHDEGQEKRLKDCEYGEYRGPGDPIQNAEEEGKGYAFRAHITPSVQFHVWAVGPDCLGPLCPGAGGTLVNSLAMPEGTDRAGGFARNAGSEPGKTVEKAL